MAFLKSLFGTKEPKTCPVCGQENPSNAKFCSNCSSEFPDVHDHYDAFISYRRESGSDLASLIKSQLESRFHKRVFLDIKELQVGKFDEKLLLRIEETANFILILSKASLDRCVNKSDWLKREIMHALKTGRNIIPVFTEGFIFPTDEVWALLPPEMHRDLPTLNGVTYSHIYQDDAIRKIASYMKTDAEVSQWHDKGDREEPQPASPGDKSDSVARAEKPEARQMKARVEMSQKVVSSPPSPIPEKTPVIQTIEPAIEMQKEKQQLTLDEFSSVPYAPIVAVVVKDVTGMETKLTKIALAYLTVIKGNGSKSIPWIQIESVFVNSRDDATIMLRDGKSLEHANLRSMNLDGSDEDGFKFSFPVEKWRALTVQRDTTAPEREAIIRGIPLLSNQPAHEWKWPIRLEHEQGGFVIAIDMILENKTYSTVTFRLPGSYYFYVNEGDPGRLNVRGDKNLELGSYGAGTAVELAHALNRLNTLLTEERADAEAESQSQQEPGTRLDGGRVQPQTKVQEPLPQSVPLQEFSAGSSNLSEPSELSLDFSTFAKQTDGSWAFVSGVWVQTFCPEPGATSELRIFPGAAFQVLKTVQFQDRKWTNIRLEDGREGWITGEPGADRVVGGIMQAFSRLDLRTFFATVHESPPRIGFLLAEIVSFSLDSFGFVDTNWGEVSIPISQIQIIHIDRRRKTPPMVKIQTENREYLGEFTSKPSDARRLNLILTKPFTTLNNLKSELEMNRILDLNTVEYAELKRIPNPHQI